MHIVIPEDPSPLRRKFASRNLLLVYGSAETTGKRLFLFLSEEVTVFIIHASPGPNPVKSLNKAYLSVHYVSEKSLVNNFEAPEVSVSPPALSESSTLVIQENRLEGDITTLAGEQLHVTMWMYTLPVASVRDGSEKVCLSVSLNNPSPKPHDEALAPHSHDNSILIDTIVYEPLPFADAVVRETSIVEALVFPPLLLNLKTSSLGNSGIRGKSEFATLRLLAPRFPAFLREDLHVNILNVNASSKSGKVTPLGFPDSPRVAKRCSVDDVYNITYGLQFHEAFFETSVDPQPNALSNMLSFHITVQYERLVEDLFLPITSVLKICWSPLIDLLGYKLLQLNRKSTVTTYNANFSKSVPHLRPGSGAMSPRSAAGGSAFSTPSLSVSKSGANLKYKPTRSTATIPATSLAVMLNVALPSSSPLSGVQLFFLGILNIPVGVVQCWKLQVINTGNRTLQLNMSNKRLRKGATLYSQPNNSSVATSVLSATNSTKRSEKEARSVRFKTEHDIQSQVALYRHYNSLKQARDGVIVLTPEINLGQLEGNQVFETEFKLVGFVKGIHNLGGLRIFDALSGEGFEVGRLLEVVVV